MLRLHTAAVIFTVTLPFWVRAQRHTVPCSTLDLPAQPGSLDCRVDNHQTSSSHISDGGTCTFICTESHSSLSSWRQCDDGKWRGDDGKCEGDNRLAALKKLPRVRRSETSRRHRRKRGWWKRLGCWLFGCSPPADNTRPSIHGCPSDIHAVADPLQTHTKVTWVEPTAYDDRDGKVRAVRHGPAPGRLFSEPVTTIRYTAQDTSGNMARCSFDIHVKVIRCTPAPPRVNNGYRICHLSTDYVLGSVCWYGCYEGHELTGASSTTIKCLRSGRWSANFPMCKKKTCKTLIEPEDTFLACTDSVNFRSICTYSCTKPGYDIPPGKRRASVCQANNRWSGDPSSIMCKDLEPPRFNSPLKNILAIADKGLITTTVNFSGPNVEDNSVSTITPVQVSGQQSGSTFRVGVHPIEYHAKDDAGNKARPFKFKVIVKELVCHTLYRTPYQTVVCEQGYRYGSPCYFSCDDDFALEGTANVTCEKMGNPPYGAWTFGKKQPTCKLQNHCPALPAPANGAMVCDTWLGGQFCQLLCRNGTDIPRTFPFYQLFQCGTKGMWNAQEFDLAQRIPDCIKPRRGRKVIYRMDMTYYFNGDCRSKTTLDEIRRSFLKILEPYSCSLHPECSVENVKVTCGNTTRGKREIEKQNVSSSDIFIEMTFSYDLQNVSDPSEIMDWVSVVMKGVRNTAQIALSTDPGSELTFVSVDKDKLAVTCPPGHLPNYRTFRCDPCDKGSYHDVTSNTCKLCPKGEYQDIEGQRSCLKCPSGYTTAENGARDIDVCQEACEAGFVSRTGTTPCSPCELSTYQPQKGQSTCISCPGSMTTVSQGAVSESECAEFDLDLEPSDSSAAQASLDTIDLDLGRVFVISWWLRVYDVSQTRLLTVRRDTADDWLVLTADGFYHIMVNSAEYNTSVNISDGMWHFIRMDVTRTDCAVSVDGGDSVSKSQTWNTRQKNISQIILGGDSFLGSVSQFNIWSSSDMLPQDPTCRSQKSGDKLSWSKFVFANLTETAVSLPSECDDFDNCASNPCFNGTCTDALHSFDCDCYHGYEGNQCDVNIDDCVDNVCENNGTCVDQVGGFTCDCSDLFTGELCEIAVVHGKWGEWEDWSTCSVSCGEGVRTRKRACTDPSPDNGGRECDGSDTEQQVCNDTVCPVCKEIATPNNGSLSCENSTLINCTMDCDEGFLPDIEPLSSYYCGEETGYIWNFETEQNPHRRLPFCSESHQPEALSVTYNIKYRDLRCGENEAAASIIQNHVMQVLQTDVTCVRDAKCNVDDVSVGCSELRREKRDVSGDNLGFTVTLRSDAGGPESGVLLETAMFSLGDHADIGSFTVNISHVLYYVDVNQTDVFGDVTCPAGMISYSYLCLPCGPGSFLADDSCMLCGYGAYQDQTGQTVCEQCPDGWTTDSWGSRDVTDCSVQRPLSTKVAIAIAVSLTVLLATAVVIITVVLVRRCGCRNAAYRLKEQPAVSGPRLTTPVLEMDDTYIQHPTTVFLDSKPESKQHEDVQNEKNVTQPLLPSLSI